MEIEDKLSKRLKKVASFVSRGAFLADIGSDHAYLPAYVCSQDENVQAIAGEVRKGPFLNAKETIASYQLDKKVEVGLGNGLEVIDERVTDITIAGMGGSLIKTILEEGQLRLPSVQKIIAQPNNQEHLVRKQFHQLQFTITNEHIIEENGHLYEIIVAERNGVSCYDQTINRQIQDYFGPCLLKEKNELFQKKWQRELLAQQDVLHSIQRAKNIPFAKEQMIKQQIQWIEEVALS